MFLPLSRRSGLNRNCSFFYETECNNNNNNNNNNNVK